MVILAFLTTTFRIFDSGIKYGYAAGRLRELYGAVEPSTPQLQELMSEFS